MITKIIFKSKITHYLFFRYLAYFLQLLNTLFFAKYLGTYYFGVYGFILILFQYFSYSNFGLQYSLNLFFTTKLSSKIRELIFSVSLYLSIISSIILILILIILSLLKLEIFLRYNLNDYLIIIIGMIGFLQVLNQLYLNIYRFFGKLSQINIFQLIVPLLQIFGYLFFEGERLFIFIIWAMFIGNLISLILFIRSNPVNTIFKFKRKIVLPLYKKGISLLIYNMSFYLITLSGLTMVGVFYSIEDLGFYNLGNNLSNAVMMLIGSVSFLLYSKLLFKFGRAKDKCEIIYILEKSRKVYLNITIFIALFFFNIIPYFNFYLSEYFLAFKAFKLLLIAQILLSNSFGYSTLLIAKKKEMVLTINAIIAVSINVILFTLCRFLNFDFLFIAWSSIFSIFYFSFKTIYDGNNITNQYFGFYEILRAHFPIKFTLPFLLLFFSVILDKSYLGFMSFLLFVILNYKELSFHFKFIIDILDNSNKILEIK